MFRFISNVTSDTLVQSRGKFGNGKNMNLWIEWSLMNCMADVSLVEVGLAKGDSARVHTFGKGEEICTYMEDYFCWTKPSLSISFLKLVGHKINNIELLWRIRYY